jgi:hypothetical protein
LKLVRNVWYASREHVITYQAAAKLPTAAEEDRKKSPTTKKQGKNATELVAYYRPGVEITAFPYGGRERVFTPSSPFQNKDGRIKGRCRSKDKRLINLKTITTSSKYMIQLRAVNAI